MRYVKQWIKHSCVNNCSQQPFVAQRCYVQLLAFSGSCMYSLTLSSRSLHQGIIFIIVCESGVPTTQEVYFRGLQLQSTF